ncbi:uncharacterized protein LOC131891908 [Tigriopus californicus]|uniref:uncharacterized protein LOC131891908 n=1 Tax=Tigriopus californicus TaxID=6832 RepID=UPI0027DA2799|nr:uncharacterized protein LOC131891908 [Tigriopus californicus]
MVIFPQSTGRSFALSFHLEIHGDTSTRRMLRYMQLLLIIIIYVGVHTVTSLESDDVSQNENARQGKLLSLFQIVRFTNDPCVGQGNRNGTCYTTAECASKGGLSSGTCAQGYGVCCSFVGNCGGTLSENGTYFESNGGETGACKLKICPCSDNICQVHLLIARLYFLVTCLLKCQDI